MINRVLENLGEYEWHFYKGAAKIAMEQIFQSIGFKSSQISAIDTLSNVTGRYMEALNSLQGFRSPWNVKQSLMKSKTLEDTMIFLRTIDEIPLVKPIPRTNSRDKETTEMGFYVTRPLPVYIPNWLPKFPDPRTYKTRIESEKEEMQNKVSGELEKIIEKKERELEMGMKRLKIRFRIGDGGGGIN
ncbi:Transcription factor TFIID, subunit 8, C-terminal [Dillenia turbinata]|uniref:Transcription initiation factor TFIID subunit 8 n=1 Tax=Dillenia turbinata TaxID=194707 RepID=A0AAN8VHV1_9MAGN